MNQVRIGKFIAEARKKQNLTQEKLAESLGITKNAVSKWERGLCLMDMSLLRPLSEILKWDSYRRIYRKQWYRKKEWRKYYKINWTN